VFAAGKFAGRALGQSLAREFGPQGVHVAHVIVDGLIDMPLTREYVVNEGREDGKINPDAVSSLLFFVCVCWGAWFGVGKWCWVVADLVLIDC
jgi:hypothetical protein